ncbi:hemin uptake protein HemP [Paraburkholderia phosphatilytica]|uniref:hemin uptake protein HemP n=1 Tax=Paraburkholderia phosphatilytica TaxID=2282883 RepID=UPI000E4EA923|nr:hemin uptake protein HemP [Paraburkholderia phosphatilytica]
MTEYTRPSTLKLSRSSSGSALTTRPRSSNGDASASHTTPRTNAGSQDESATATRTVRSDTLLQGRSHISIVHNGETYQLRATRLGKLILTK